MNGVAPPGLGRERYAYLLGIGTQAGLALLVVLFAIYMLGIIEPHVALDRLPGLWHLSAERYLQQTGIADGWGWTSLIHRADMLNLVGIVALGIWSVPCVLAIMPIYWRAGQRLLCAICGLEAVVILLAATGLVGGGH